MRPFTQREAAVIRLLTFVGIDFAVLQITRTGLDKGYTDATTSFRNFLKRTGIHDFASQRPGEKFIKYVDVFGLTTNGPELFKLSFLRPAAKGGRMFRVSMVGGIKRPLHIQDTDVLMFSVRENQLQVANLTDAVHRMADSDHIGVSSGHTARGATIVTIAKNRILHVMELMPECEAKTGSGARAVEIGELTGMFLETHRTSLVNALVEELRGEGRIEPVPNDRGRFRLCR